MQFVKLCKNTFDIIQCVRTFWVTRNLHHLLIRQFCKNSFGELSAFLLEIGNFIGNIDILINTNTAKATGKPEGTLCVFRPYLMMLTAQGDFVPWVASQSDLLADDWEVVG